MGVLVAAWHAIRRNAETSQRSNTRLAARKFGENLPANLRRLQDRLRTGYKFAKAHGATPKKGKGKQGKRPIVVAPLTDRIVQRAILDVLQDAAEIEDVQHILATPTSIGGIRGRGVDHAISIFADRVLEGDRYVAGSDISGFFQRISRRDVIDFLTEAGVEADFVALVEAALNVELANEDRLSKEDRKLFPTGEDGVAQGCPLSALAGNIVLRDFDRKMNDRGITCVRYIDDFILIGQKSTSVRNAMKEARAILSRLGMTIYDPHLSPTKAFEGMIGEAHPFLGYDLIPDKYPPTEAAREKLMARIAKLIKDGQRSIAKAVTDRPLTSHDRCYAQTLAAIDNTICGWRGSFKSSTAQEVFREIDAEIDRKLHDFRSFYLAKINKQSRTRQRQALGVSLLAH